jgi:alkaline phosphatase D
VTSCANYPEGFFNAYAHIADRTDLDLVLCLGDYFYEYPNNEYGDGTDLGRVPRPDREVISLADYRLRHATYKLDPDLQAAHAAHPWVVVWDDHESANNSWKGGAENHNPDKGEGDWNDRRLAAVRAYYEWMPIRELPTGLFRSFRIGDLAELIMLDTRLEGRAEQVAAGDNDGAESVERSLLGPIQESAFFEALTEAQQDRVTWKLVGQQVVFAPLIEQSGSFNPDAWDGYRESRRRVLRHIERDRIEGVVVLTGDVHSAWALEVPDEDEAGRLAVELVAPAVSARPLASSERFRQLVENAREQIPHVRYVDGDHTHEQVVAQWLQTGDPRVRSSETRVGATMRTTHGSNRLQLT